MLSSHQHVWHKVTTMTTSRRYLLSTDKTFSEIIEFGIDICAKDTFKGDKLTKRTDLNLYINYNTKELDGDGTQI